jgi:hypothetical protein
MHWTRSVASGPGGSPVFAVHAEKGSGQLEQSWPSVQSSALMQALEVAHAVT